MSLTENDLIEYFWTNFDQAEKPTQYVRLLDQVEAYTLEIFSAAEDEGNSVHLDSSPFLAMVSEIEYACPEAVLLLAQKSDIIAYSLSLVRSYPAEKRLQLRKIFLKRDDGKVISFQVLKKKSNRNLS